MGPTKRIAAWIRCNSIVCTLCRNAANLLDLQMLSGSVLLKGLGKDVFYMNGRGKQIKKHMLKFCMLLFFIHQLRHSAAKGALTI